MVVADLSFISLRTVADALVRLVAPGGDLVVLVKPQFEAGRTEADRGRGIIRDPAVWRRTLLEVGEALVGREAAIMGVMVSPITGGDGNVEFLLHARVGGPGAPAGSREVGTPEAMIEDAVDTAAASHPDRGAR